jgi:hypothetical protein
MHDILTALDNVLKDGQDLQMTQHPDTFAQPPGAAITAFPSLTRLRQAEHSLQDLLTPGHLEAGIQHTTQTLTTFSTDADGQCDGLEASVYTPDPADPMLPSPSPTHVFQLRHSFFRQS